MENVEAIQALVERGVTQEIDGKIYSPVGLRRVIHDPQPLPLAIRTLTGLADYIKSKIDQNALSKIFVVVESFTSVALYQELNPETMLRRNFMRVELEKLREFQFGQFTDNENFLIQLRSMFMSNTDRERLLRFASQVSVDESLKTQDDGVSQSVAVNKGMSGALKEKQIAPSVVSLIPYRTFREVDQPASEFIFRMRAAGTGQPPYCALFEADGGAWKLQAMKNIATWLKANLKTVTVLA